MFKQAFVAHTPQANATLWGNKTKEARSKPVNMVELFKRLSIYAMLFCLASSANASTKIQQEGYVIFDEDVVYSPGFPLITISFASDGTLFFNDGFNIFKLIDGEAMGVGDIRPDKDKYDFERYYGIAVAPNGTLYVGANEGSYGSIYKVVEGKISNDTRIYFRYGAVKEIAFNPNGELHFTDGEAVFSTVEGCLFNLSLFAGDGAYVPLSIKGLAFAPDGNLFASVVYGHSVGNIMVNTYAAICQIKEDKSHLIYVRYPDGVNNIDDVAVSPDGTIYFEDYDLGYGRLYKLVPKAGIYMQNASFFPYLYPVITNSTILGYSYNHTSNQMELNLTGPKGTSGASVVTFFAEHFGGKQFHFEVTLNTHPANHTEIKGRDYAVYFAYNHSAQILVTVKPLYVETPDQTAFHLGIALSAALVVLALVIIALRRHAREYE